MGGEEIHARTTPGRGKGEEGRMRSGVGGVKQHEVRRVHFAGEV